MNVEKQSSNLSMISCLRCRDKLNNEQLHYQSWVYLFLISEWNRTSQMTISHIIHLGVATHYSVSLIKRPVTSALERVGNSYHYTYGSCHESLHTQSYPYLASCHRPVRRMSKYAITHTVLHNVSRSRDSWYEIHLIVISSADRPDTMFSTSAYAF